MSRFLLIAFLAISLVGCISDYDVQNSGFISNLPVKVPTTRAYTYQTTNGVLIESVVEIPEDRQADVFSSIEIGINKQIRATGEYFGNWHNARNLSDYKIIFIKPDTFNVETDPGSPALLYNGSIQTAGTCLGFGGIGSNLKPPAIVLPHQADSNWSHLEYLSASARNESEHFVEGANDLNVWRQYTTAFDQHPHRTYQGE